MNRDTAMKEDRLTRVLQKARPEPGLPPRFQEAVWRRIERDDPGCPRSETSHWFERLVTLLLRPRLAIGGAVAMLLLGGMLGVLDGIADAHQAARDQYVASVVPYGIR